jgi:aspartate aminotransferase
MVKVFAERRLRIVDLLRQIKGVTCVTPKGAFYVFPNISHFGLDSKTFAERLIDTQAVATVPGISFGADANIRLSYACSMEEIEEGISRIATFCASL